MNFQPRIIAQLIFHAAKLCQQWIFARQTGAYTVRHKKKEKAARKKDEKKESAIANTKSAIPAARIVPRHHIFPRKIKPRARALSRKIAIRQIADGAISVSRSRLIKELSLSLSLFKSRATSRNRSEASENFFCIRLLFPVKRFIDRQTETRVVAISYNDCTQTLTYVRTFTRCKPQIRGPLVNRPRGW